MNMPPNSPQNKNEGLSMLLNSICFNVIGALLLSTPAISLIIKTRELSTASFVNHIIFGILFLRAGKLFLVDYYQWQEQPEKA